MYPSVLGHPFAPFKRRPASFSVSNHEPQPSRPRAGSHELGVERELEVKREGFPLLQRRRTFTEPSKRRCVHGEGSGRSGESTAMRSSSRSTSSRSSSWSRSNRSSSGSGDDGSRSHSLPADTARRNELIIRLHRVGMVQDMARCVMDIVEGRAAARATGWRGGEKADRLEPAVFAPTTAAVTLEEVKEHLQSLPERYALSVEAEDVLQHMALVADIAASLATTTAAVSPAPAPHVRVLVRGDGGVKRGCERFSVAVACRQCPFLLGAISSSLRSAGATCLDADVVNTRPIAATHGFGVCLARLEIEVPAGGRAEVSTPSRLAAAAAAAAAVNGGGASVQPSAQTPLDGNPEGKPAAAAALLADLLSSALAASMLAAEEERDDGEEGRRRGQAGEGEKVAEEEEEEEGGNRDRARGSGVVGGAGRDAQPQAQPCAAASGAQEVVAEAEEAVPAPALAQQQAAGRQGRREPLARRQGCFFAAEADANALGSNGNSDALSFGAAAFAVNVASNGNGNSGGAGKAGKSSSRRTGMLPRIPNDESIGIGNACYPTIPPEDIELLELAGKGRFSRTYRARCRGSTVAVKTLELPPEADEASTDGGDRSVIVAEFERELHIVRKLRHPRVCGFRGVCVASPRHLSLVYDFLANGTLGDRLRDNGGGGFGGGNGGWSGGGGDEQIEGPLPLRSASLVRIVKDVVDGMLYLHEVGVLHRDLKPDNILLDADDRAVIADFGLSRLCQPTDEHTAETGTYRWMAPEVIRHEPYNQAADVYSFGIVLWQVLTKRQPFEGLTPIQAAFSVARQGLRPPLPPTAPPALSSLIRRCWHRSPPARPSFSQVRSELPEIEKQILSSSPSA